MTLAQLHSVLQTLMGSDDYHLHQFSTTEDESITLGDLPRSDWQPICGVKAIAT
jgi:hypothetical protein